MKLHLLIVFILTISSATLAQSALETRCPYKGEQVTSSMAPGEAQDFTITTTDGITRNLYNTLDSGKTVFIDLFYTTCYYCQLHAPTIEEIYQNTGAGEDDIEFWGISNNLFDTNNVIDAYKEQYGITNPCAGPIGGGGATALSIVVDGQNFLGFPSYCVICPDRTMFFDPVYPPTVTGFDPYFETCAATIGINEEIMNSKFEIVSVYPNPASSELYLEAYFQSSGKAIVEISDLSGRTVLSQDIDLVAGTNFYEISIEGIPAGTFFVKLFRDNQMVGSRKILIHLR